MTAHITTPFIHVEDSNGNPYVGAKLYVYQVGTTTLANIYSDSGLSVAMTNPLSGVNASDAAGNFPRVYLAAGTYKLRAETSSGTLIWQYDEIDTGLTSNSGPLAITAGGTGATTAPAALANLGAASQTDVDDLASDIASLSSSLQNIVSMPQGRLTMTSGTPVIAANVLAGTSVYYTPFNGNLIPIYDGSQFVTSVFAELTLTLNSNHVASAIYDVFIWKESGVVTIGTGPAWNTATAGAGARGSGAGTTELTRTNGLWTNANAMTTRNGATTYTVVANRATYVGSIFMDGSNGQLTCHVAWGQSRKWGVWNAYNRNRVILKAGDSTVSWAYNTSTIRSSNGSAANSLTIFAGLAEDYYDLKFVQTLSPVTNSSTVGMEIGIGVNSTTNTAGRRGISLLTNATSNNITTRTDAVANYVFPAALGINTVNALETTSSGANTVYYGTETNMLLSAEWAA